jgi:putative oxidoreductase
MDSAGGAAGELMKGLLFNRWTRLSLRMILGGVFLYAGVLKMKSPQDFADSISTFQLLPVAWINLLALSLPPFEMIAGIMLIVTIIFALAIGQALARGLQVNCGCFGGGAASSTWKTWAGLGRDLILFVAAFLAYRAAVQAHTQE